MYIKKIMSYISKQKFDRTAKSIRANSHLQLFI